MLNVDRVIHGPSVYSLALHEYDSDIALHLLLDNNIYHLKHILFQIL